MLLYRIQYCSGKTLKKWKEERLPMDVIKIAKQYKQYIQPNSFVQRNKDHWLKRTQNIIQDYKFDNELY